MEREDGLSDLEVIAGFSPKCLRPVTYGFGVGGAERDDEGDLRSGL